VCLVKWKGWLAIVGNVGGMSGVGHELLEAYTTRASSKARPAILIIWIFMQC
jgi:hypothetical protein